MKPRAAAVLLLVLFVTSGCGEKTPRRPPNLLLVTIDTLRADRIACYGGPEDVGRFLCSLADEGTRFEWALSAAPYTAPSVASILTGRYPSFHGVTQSGVSYLRGESVTVTELLKAAGYMTAAFISNPVLDRSRNLTQGFDVWDQEMPRRERNRPGYAERAAEEATDASLAWAQISAKTPWFLWVHYQDPHGPYEPPNALPEFDDDGSPRLPILKNHSGRGGIPAYQALPGLATPGPYRRRYLDEIRYLDPHLERLVKGLDGLGERPAVLVTSDHGESFGEDGYWFSHGHSVTLDQVRVPLLWRAPGPAGEARGSVVSTPVTLVDVAPTLLAAAGIDVPSDMQGRPLPVPGVNGDADEHEAIFLEHAHSAGIVREGTYYARSRGDAPEPEHAPGTETPAHALPPRTATLDGGNAGLPSYQTVETGSTPEELESLLAEFLGSGQAQAGAVHEQISPELEERLGALGYVD